MLYLYRIGVLEWLPQLCDDIWIPQAVVDELQDGQRKGYDVPIPSAYSWLQVVEPQAVPSEWLALDLGAGELAVLAIALGHPQRVVLLDDGRPRRIAQAAIGREERRKRAGITYVEGVVVRRVQLVNFSIIERSQRTRVVPLLSRSPGGGSERDTKTQTDDEARSQHGASLLSDESTREW